MSVLEAGKTDGHGGGDDDCGMILMPGVMPLVSVVKITGQKMTLIHIYVGMVIENGSLALQLLLWWRDYACSDVSISVSQKLPALSP